MDIINTTFGKIAVKTWEPEVKNSLPPIILFHDSLGSIELWRIFPEELAKKIGRKVIAYDRLGFGKSDKRDKLPSKNFIQEEATLFFPQLIKSLDIKSFILFGHSVGGAMAIECAAHFHKECLGVITESAQAFVEERTLEGIKQAKKDFENPGMLSRLEKYHGDKAKWVLHAWIDVWTSEEFQTWSLKEALLKVSCPVLALHGENDEYGSVAFPKMISEESQGISSYKILKNCGHVPHKEMPEVILEEVRSFIDQSL